MQVYKLSEINGEPKLKLSETIQKVTFPGVKQVYRFTDDSDSFVADAIALAEDPIPSKMIHPFDIEKSKPLDIKMATPLLHIIMDKGKSLFKNYEPYDIAKFVKKRMEQLPEEHKRFNNPHIYKVGISEPLHQLRSDLRKKYRL
jgi:nicotinate phosphoribosyltransferase